MPAQKTLKRTFAAELQSLPVKLVPPDPQTGVRPASGPHGATRSLPEQPPVESDVLARLISKIKRI